MNDYTELLNEAIEDAKPVNTGLPALDDVLGGGIHEGVSVICGDPGAGKTALAVQLALFAANSDCGRVVYCMSDMGGKKSALLRMVSCAAAVAGIDGCELGRAGEWSPREREEGLEALERVTTGNIRLSDTKDVSELLAEVGNEESRLQIFDRLRVMYSSLDKDNPEDMAEFIKLRDVQRELTEPVCCLVCDFAQSMSWQGRPLAFDTEAASCAVRELREWAHQNNCVVLLLSAYSKAARDAHNRGAQPTMNDILGSAELSYSAEHVLAISNPRDGKGTAIVRDLKSRYGSGESCTLHIDPQHGLFG